MKLLTISDSLNNGDKLIATIGVFDGVHRGHKLILSELSEIAHKNNLKSAVVTFSNHPQFFFNADTDLRLIMSAKEKIDAISQLGIDYCILLDFNEEIASLTSSQFMALLHDKYNVAEMLVGYDHKFGHDRNSTFEDYRKNAESIGLKITKSQEFTGNFDKVSSSTIRKIIALGDVKIAGEMLGRPFQLSGKVVAGKQNGRTIGFPTANMEVPDPNRLLPKNGVYAVKVKLESGECRNGICNIGVRPTIDNEGAISIETYIFDFSGDIYGEVITLYFIERIRDEKRFNSLYELKEQITKDKFKAKNILEI